MVQARAAWRDASAAHEAAAVRIQERVNSKHGLDPWQLDLHGLHAEEVRPKKSQPTLHAAPGMARSVSSLHPQSLLCTMQDCILFSEHLCFCIMDFHVRFPGSHFGACRLLQLWTGGSLHCTACRWRSERADACA